MIAASRLFDSFPSAIKRPTAKLRLTSASLAHIRMRRALSAAASVPLAPRLALPLRIAPGAKLELPRQVRKPAECDANSYVCKRTRAFAKSARPVAPRLLAQEAVALACPVNTKTQLKRRAANHAALAATNRLLDSCLACSAQR